MENATHYAYEDYASGEYANSYDKTRFGDVVGSWVNDTDRRLISRIFGYMSQERMISARILDVGTGTGRIALVLGRMGFSVTGIDASEQMLAVLDRKSKDQRIDIDIQQGEVMDLRFKDKSFDYSVSFMTIMHVPDWKKMLQEMCRVTAKGLLIQFQSRCSYAFFTPLIQPFRRKKNKVYQMWKFHQLKEVVQALSDNGFESAFIGKQFLFPVAFHRLLKNLDISIKLESWGRSSGMTRVFGNPVVIYASRKK